MYTVSTMPDKQDKVNIDVMTNNGKYHYKSLQYPYNPLFKFDVDDMMLWLYDSLPSLKTRKDIKLCLDFPDGESYELIPTNKIEN